MTEESKHTRRDREAYHEAGHVVARVLLGLPFSHVSVENKVRFVRHYERGRQVKSQQFYLEGVAWDPAYTQAVNDDLFKGKLDMREAVAAMAGGAAEANLVGELDEAAKEGQTMDVQHIAAACRCALSGCKGLEHWTPSDMESALMCAAGVEALGLLVNHWTQVEAVAGALLERRRLSYDEAAAIVKGDV